MSIKALFLAAATAFCAHGAWADAAAASLADCTSRFDALAAANKLDGISWSAFRASVCGLPITPAATAAALGAVQPVAPPTVAAPAVTVPKAFAPKPVKASSGGCSKRNKASVAYGLCTGRKKG
jgi:hypothetical protein